jgi:hypothetical protein
VDRLDVLVRIEGAIDQRLGDASRHRPQHQDPRDARIGVELPDHGEDVGDLGVVREVLVGVVALEALGQPPDVPFVGSCGVVVSDKDRGEPGSGAGDLELPKLLVHVVGELLREFVAVDHGPCHAHALPSATTRDRASAGTPARR